MKLYIMKQEALDFFKNNMDKFYSNYYKYDSNEWLQECYGSNPFVEYREISDIDLYPITSDASSGEIEFNNCKLLYQSLLFITPSQACDERLWAGLCNGTFYEYVRKRWKYDQIKRGDPKKDCSTILSRFFFTNSTKGGLYRNTLAKCWWVGYHLYDATKQNPFEKLDILGQSDISTKINEIFYSNNFSANHNILDGIIEGIRYLREDNYTISTRTHIRPALQYLNVVGGGILLDCLDKKDIATIFYDTIVGIIQEDDVSITFDEEQNENFEESEEQVLVVDSVSENEGPIVMDYSKIMLKNKTTGATKKYFVQRLESTSEYPELIELCIGKTEGDEVTYRDDLYEIMEIKNTF